MGFFMRWVDFFTHLFNLLFCPRRHRPVDGDFPSADVGDTDVDVVIIGAGISGITAAFYLQTDCQRKRYVILEGRHEIGGTWSLFKYPGIRSDSEMFTLGFSFNPWPYAKSIAPGALICDYVRATAEKFGIVKHIRFNTRVCAANWHSPTQRWVVTAVQTDRQTKEETEVTFTGRFLVSGAGYYDYGKPFQPDFPGQDVFKGEVVHPQHWDPQHVRYHDKKVVIIGSGATAMTLAPSLADKAEHVTLLQRSPTYVVAAPSSDATFAFLMKWGFSLGMAFRLLRVVNIVKQMYYYRIAKTYPAKMAEGLKMEAMKQLPEGYDMAHFTPSYNPWDQRICLVPDGDLFKSISDKKMTVVTAHIDTFTATGIQLQSGEHLEADIIVSATGLELQMLGGIKLSMDDVPVDFSKQIMYKGAMYEGIPNLFVIFGYLNASWTIKAEMVAQWFCRIICSLDTEKKQACRPTFTKNDLDLSTEPIFDFTSGYISRAQHLLPRHTATNPWTMHQNYFKDVFIYAPSSLRDRLTFF